MFTKGLDKLPAEIDRGRLFTFIADFAAGTWPEAGKARLVEWAEQRGGDYAGETLLATVVPSMSSMGDEQVRAAFAGLSYGPRLEIAITNSIITRGDIDSWAGWIDGQNFPVSGMAVDSLAERLVRARPDQADAFVGNSALTGVFSDALRSQLAGYLERNGGK